MAASLVKKTDKIRRLLKVRFEELNLTLTDIVKDAKDRGKTLSIASLSKYLRKSDINNLSEESIIWLCFRYGVFIQLKIHAPETEGSNLKLFPYNEKLCLKLLNEVFPNENEKK